jgi:hypothetical protein
MKKIPKEGNIFIKIHRGQLSLQMNANMFRGIQLSALNKIYYKLDSEKAKQIDPYLINKALMNVDFQNKKIHFYKYCPKFLVNYLDEMIIPYKNAGFTVV